MFLIVHYTETDLTLAKIFSTLDVIVSFKIAIYMLVTGLGFYYEVKVVFKRFASIFNI